MASISRDRHGSTIIQFTRTIGTNPDGTPRRKRATVRVGQVSPAEARRFCGYIERLAIAAASGAGPTTMERDLVAFIDGLDDHYHAKLAAVGLVARRTPDRLLTLDTFVGEYIRSRADARPRTIINLKSAQKELVAYFTPQRSIRTITEGDAVDFYRWMTTRDKAPAGHLKARLGQNTARRICGRSKQFFAPAVKSGLIARNPFDGINCHVNGNSSRLQFVEQPVILAVLEQVHDPEFRAALILARWGGLRIPSEIADMRWGDVNWAQKRLTIRQIKLARHEGKERKLIPLFPEIEPALAALYTEPFGPEEKVFRRVNLYTNLRTNLQRYIRLAGLKPWPRLWQNLRASRATEIAETYPQHVATEWMGHTPAVAEAHYWQTRERYYKAATRKKALPKALQTNPARPRTVKKAQANTPHKPQ